MRTPTHLFILVFVMLCGSLPLVYGQSVTPESIGQKRIALLNAAARLAKNSAGDPCETAERIEFTQTIEGVLALTDCRLEDGSYADFYMFDAVAGERATISIGSGVFLTYLGLANESGTFVVEDPNFIDVVLPETGTYIILANSLLPDEFGAYTLNLTGGPDCTFVFTPSSAEIPAAGGTFSFDLATQPRCYWAAGSVFSGVATNSTGLGNGTVIYTVTPNPTNQERVMNIGVRGTYFNLRQAELPCNYVLNPISANVGPSSTTGSFSVSVQQGCFWSAQSQAGFLNATGSANGNGTVEFTVSSNNGVDRSGSIRVGNFNFGELFTVNQTGLSCTFSVTPTSLNIPAAGWNGDYVINTQPGCSWSVTRNQLWVEMQIGSGSGPATIPVHIARNTERSSRSAAIQIFFNADPGPSSIATFIDQAGQLSPVSSDFDGDGRSDISVFRADTGAWYLQRSTAGYFGTGFGAAEDKIVPADYDGDGKTDIAVYRPSTGIWYVTNSSNGAVVYHNFGIAEDLPTPADYDGDGKADISVFRPSTGTWYRTNSSTGAFVAAQFGASGDKPTVGDFDGDGRADVAVFRPSTGAWYQTLSSNGFLFGEQFGVATDRITPADYDGDGKTDIAIYRPSEGLWYVKRSATTTYVPYVFGLAEDITVPADFDGDGKADIGVFRPSDGTWYIVNSTNGSYTIFHFGQSGDKPTQSAFGN